MEQKEFLKRLFDAHLEVEVVLSNRYMYQVSGVKRSAAAHSHGSLTHSHSHGDHTHDHLPDPDATPMEELLALMKYMVSHNDAHAQEMAELATQIRNAGKEHAYHKIMDAVSDFDILNAKFDAVFEELSLDAE